LLVGQVDLPRLAFHELATFKAPSLQPFYHGLLRNAECIGGTLHGVAAIWPAKRILIDAVDLAHRAVGGPQSSTMSSSTWARSNRNGGRHHLGMAGAIIPEFAHDPGQRNGQLSSPDARRQHGSTWTQAGSACVFRKFPHRDFSKFRTSVSVITDKDSAKSLRLHLQNLANRARKVYNKPAPSNARTKHPNRKAPRFLQRRVFC
jgi:hypothetical protein